MLAAIETLPTDEFSVPIPDEVFAAPEHLGADVYGDFVRACNFIHVWAIERDAQ